MLKILINPSKNENYAMFSDKDNIIPVNNLINEDDKNKTIDDISTIFNRLQNYFYSDELVENIELIRLWNETPEFSKILINKSSIPFQFEDLTLEEVYDYIKVSLSSINKEELKKSILDQIDKFKFCFLEIDTKDKVSLVKFEYVGSIKLSDKFLQFYNIQNNNICKIKFQEITIYAIFKLDDWRDGYFDIKAYSPETKNQDIILLLLLKIWLLNLQK